MKYPAYPEYEDSGIPWIGKKPKHWQLMKLHHIVRMKSGSSITSLEMEDDGEYPVFGGNGQRGRFSDYTHEGSFVLIGRQGAECGNINYAHGKFWASEHAVVAIPDRKLDYRWLGEMLWAMNLNQYSQSAAQPGLSVEVIGRLQVPFPPVSEQQQIAAFLDRKTAQIDALIAKKKALIEKLKEKRLVVITQAVTKGLDDTVPMKDSRVDWLGEVPKHWDVGGFLKFVENRVDYRGKTPEKVPQGVFLVTAKNIKNGKINYQISQEYVREEDYDTIMSRGTPLIGDLLFTTEAPLGEIANVDNKMIALAQRIIKFRGEADKLNNYFARYWMLGLPFQGHLQSLSTGSTATGIKASKLFELRIVVPPLDEQISIVKFLDIESKAFDDKEKNIVEVIKKLLEYRAALITATVTGKIDIRNVELNQEAT
ncbi:MAG: restriction endonuclease subunit S [Candidatus Thiodiazotropha sp. (ex Epidulcina cf. delphinae)]|nr:restriction endonuclease subunit S [Candidatus Thiodiazotropha sp. (ex Epidulcina cf. delphinae)]